MGLRQEKLKSQLRKELSEILTVHKDWVGNQFISISAVSVTPDLSYAKVFYSNYNAKDRELAAKSLDLYNKEIRRELAKKLRNNLKKIPELTFILDETVEYMEKVDALFNKLGDS